MAERIWGVEVVSVDVVGNKLIGKHKKFAAGKTTELTFVVAAATPIKDKTGRPIKLSDILPGNKINMDYLKGSDGTLAAQSIKQA